MLNDNRSDEILVELKAVSKEPGIMAIANILIVDDNPANLKVLEDMLRHRGYEVSSFPRGELALAAAALDPPDLILLDVNMPDMNGYEACKRFKATELLADIPVIFLSALNETEDKLKAFRVGGADFVSKPFQFEEVHARVNTHLQLHSLQNALKKQNHRLEEAVAARTHELAESNEKLKMLDRSKNDFLNLISHEFRTPLNGLLGISELVLEEMHPTVINNQLKEAYYRSRVRILSILDEALLLAQIDVCGPSLRSGQVPLGTVLNRAVERSSEFAESREVKIGRLPLNLGLVHGDSEWLERAFQTLIDTSIKFAEKGKTVQLTSAVDADAIQVIIDSRGRTIPNSAIARFFDIFSIGEAINPGGDLGLGPPLAQRILSSMGASVNVSNLEHPSGIRFTVVLRRLEIEHV